MGLFQKNKKSKIGEQKMPRINYRNVSIPLTLIDQVDEIVKSKLLGYSSRSELVKDALRDKLREIRSGQIKR